MSHNTEYVRETNNTPSWQSLNVINVGVTWSTYYFADLAYNTYLPHIVTIAYLLGLSLSRASSGKCVVDMCCRPSQQSSV